MVERFPAEREGDNALQVIDRVAKELAPHHAKVTDFVRHLATGRSADLLVESLEGQAPERRDETESQQLARSLHLSFAEKPKWAISIWLAEDTPNMWFGAHQRSTQINLKFGSDGEWVVDVRDVDGRRPPEVPRLRRLADFPGWLGECGKALGMTFSVEHADINCGRYRASVETIRAWLEAV